ncbi:MULTISPECIES: helix-turn-helix transcriptional regulator [Pseudomonadaceae]|jgi:transcriptional regulator with XRE-family HTH domain|uniref:helix-turn-helix transcriptional regulator n=1 Tax=Pseudomonadaceae TaxID=135621 RepID=UPI0009E283D4|nr:MULTISPECIES: helix-turn-helix transcriptional regulator [Pseudomonas]
MLHQALRLIRTYHDLSQKELADELSVSNSFLSEIESGKKQPSLELLGKYSERFNVPLSSILFFSESLESSKPTDRLRVGIARKIINIMEWVGNKNEAKSSMRIGKKA